MSVRRASDAGAVTDFILADQRSSMGRQSFTVTGMSCGGCEENVENSVGDIEGVSGVTADHESDTVEVDADGVADGDIAAAIEDAGYDVEA